LIGNMRDLLPEIPASILRKKLRMTDCRINPVPFYQAD